MKRQSQLTEIPRLHLDGLDVWIRNVVVSGQRTSKLPTISRRSPLPSRQLRLEFLPDRVAPLRWKGGEPRAEWKPAYPPSNSQASTRLSRRHPSPSIIRP